MLPKNGISLFRGNKPVKCDDASTPPLLKGSSTYNSLQYSITGFQQTLGV